MKSIVIYYSETGNTEKIAKAISNSIGAELKRVEDIKIEDISDYNLIFIGTPVHGFGPSEIMKGFLENLPSLSGKKGAAFCTMHRFGNKKTIRVIKESLEAKEIVFIDGFSCRGLSRLFANFGPRIFNRGRPNEEDLKNAEDFGRRILDIASK